MPGQASAQKSEFIDVPPIMAAAGAAAYRAWESNNYERGKLNAVANLVAAVYRSMEEQRRRAQLSSQ